MSYLEILSGRVASIESGHYPSLLIGLDANKPSSPSKGDMYYATDTEFLYLCFTSGTWFNRYLKLDANRDLPHARPKAASANLRHSNDAEASTGSSDNTILKTFTFAYGISGTLRISFDFKSIDGATSVMAVVMKNGVSSLGNAQYTTGAAYTPVTQDIDVSVLSPGDRITLVGHSNGANTLTVRNFRISYDNAPDAVLVTGVTAS